MTLPGAQLLTDAGFILWAPAGTALPANTVVGGVFTDPWPAAWIALGRTSGGLKIDDNATTADIESAEDYYPLASRTTKRVGQVSFSLLSNTATNLARALNGATTTVTGTTTTTLTQVDSPNPVNEVPCMIGWESLDSTVRYIARQVRNAGNLSMQMAKAPNAAQIPWTGNLEKPASAQPYSFFYAGTARA
ncbi:MAG: phage tail tube protein [Frankiaceae bacterium]